MTDHDANQRSIEALAALVDKAGRNPQALTPGDIYALRACADHVGREAAAVLRCTWDGEQPTQHDRLDWLDMLTYVNDPF